MLLVTTPKRGPGFFGNYWPWDRRVPGNYIYYTYRYKVNNINISKYKDNII